MTVISIVNTTGTIKTLLKLCQRLLFCFSVPFRRQIIPKGRNKIVRPRSGFVLASQFEIIQLTVPRTRTRR